MYAREPARGAGGRGPGVPPPSLHNTWGVNLVVLNTCREHPKVNT